MIDAEEVHRVDSVFDNEVVCKAQFRVPQCAHRGEFLLRVHRECCDRATNPVACWPCLLYLYQLVSAHPILWCGLCASFVLPTGVSITATPLR